MTLDKRDKDTLISHRIKKSEETYKEVEILINLKLYNIAINRIYYGMYYILSALALKENFITSKHMRLLGWFNNTFIKTKIIDIRYGKIIKTSFEMRSKSDYDDFADYSLEETKELFNEMREFIECLKELIFK